MADRPRINPRAGGSLSWRRTRGRWAIGLAIAGVWLGYAVVSGSLLGSTALVLTLGVLGVIVALILRSLGLGPHHPLLQPLATRPWRDGRDVFQLALRNMRQAFIISPAGSLIAPSAIELCMNPADLRSLAEVIDLDIVNVLAAEAYEAAVTAYSARTFRHSPLEVAVVDDPDVPAGRYRIRQRGRAASDALANAAVASDVLAGAAVTLAPTKTLPTGPAPTSPPPNPLLRLVTNGTGAQTRLSGARAGRARAAELLLPDELTVSRLHARFRCESGQWFIIALGRNGVVVNGTEVTGERRLCDGDVVCWGRQADALMSRVEIR